MAGQKITTDQIKWLASAYFIEYAALMAVITVESSGVGFNPPTGKIIIRFEPTWFKRLKKDWQKDTEHTTWQNTGAGNQAAQWLAFNNAFASDPDDAMKSTSIGMMQVMGFHYEELGFATVGAMWDYAKDSEANQVDLGLKFIKSIPALLKALRGTDWKTFAYYYNGQNYRVNNYNQRLLTAYNKFK
jgi:hypothetical protein